jgi:hypothetical protein
MSNENLDGKLDSLWRDYRAACPDVEPSAEFMPRMWQKIEARQTIPFAMGRFTRVFVSMSAVLSLFMGTLLLTPYVHTQGALISFVEAVDGELDTVAYADIDVDHQQHGDPSWQ